MGSSSEESLLRSDSFVLGAFLEMAVLGRVLWELRKKFLLSLGMPQAPWRSEQEETGETKPAMRAYSSTELYS